MELAAENEEIEVGNQSAFAAALALDPSLRLPSLRFELWRIRIRGKA
jgi:hypothetical protein